MRLLFGQALIAGIFMFFISGGSFLAVFTFFMLFAAFGIACVVTYPLLLMLLKIEKRVDEVKTTVSR